MAVRISSRVEWTCEYPATSTSSSGSSDETVRAVSRSCIFLTAILRSVELLSGICVMRYVTDMALKRQVRSPVHQQSTSLTVNFLPEKHSSNEEINPSS